MKSLLQELIDIGAEVELAELNNKNWGGNLEFGEDIQKTGYCNRLIHENGITPEGDVVLCGCWAAFDNNLVMGNINTSSLEEIYNNPLFKQIKLGQECGIYKYSCENCNDFYPAEDN